MGNLLNIYQILNNYYKNKQLFHLDLIKMNTTLFGSNKNKQIRSLKDNNKILLVSYFQIKLYNKIMILLFLFKYMKGIFKFLQLNHNEIINYVMILEESVI